MKKVAKVMRFLFEMVSIIGVFGALSIDDSTVDWWGAFMICTLIFIAGILGYCLFDKIAKGKLYMPNWMGYLFAIVYTIFHKDSSYSRKYR